MIRAVKLAAIFSLFTGGACAQMKGSSSVPLNQPEEIGLRRLQGAELTSAIVNKSIIPRRGALASPYSEHFAPGGYYTGYGDRVAAHGKYHIERDRVCVSMPHLARCFMVLRDRYGRFYVKDESVGSRPMVVSILSHK